MKTGVILLFCFFSLRFASGALAETSIKAEVDKLSLTTDDTLTYKLVVISSGKNIPSPVIPKFKGFNVLSQAQSTSISFAKGKAETQLVYVFILVAHSEGKLKIEPGAINIGKETYSSEQFEIEVKQGKTKPQIPKQRVTPEDKESFPESKEPQITL